MMLKCLAEYIRKKPDPEKFIRSYKEKHDLTVLQIYNISARMDKELLEVLEEGRRSLETLSFGLYVRIFEKEAEKLSMPITEKLTCKARDTVCFRTALKICLDQTIQSAYNLSKTLTLNINGTVESIEMCKELVLELKKRSDATFERYYPRVGMVVPGELFCDTGCKELISTYHFIFIEIMKKLSDIRSNCEKEIELLKSELKRFEIQLY